MPHRKALAVAFSVLSLGAISLLVSQNVTQVQAPTGFTTPTGCPTGNLPAGVGPCESSGLAESPNMTFAQAQEVFEETEGIPDGLGPLFNDTSCASCHQSPVTGGASQVSEFRAGHRDLAGNFVGATVLLDNGAATLANRSLINDRAICPQAQGRITLRETLTTFRMSLPVLGDGFVEAIDDSTLAAIAAQQRAATGGRIAGQLIRVPVLEAGNALRAGRFGWKNQHASLLSFAADAYLNEMGVTTRLAPVDTTTVCKTTSDPESVEDATGVGDLDRFAFFMRATKAPPRDAVAAATPDAQAGERLFANIGCAMCHVASITTAPAGTVVNGGKFTIPAALGGKTIHPYSDFLLHNVGTGDGIVQNGPPETANKFRTPPLWGLRTRIRLMHDGESLTRHDAIVRHAGEATGVINNYRGLSVAQKNALIAFLNSL
ncbi:MAG TPA: di-heme oxidoredictase family protein [Terriglobales bacterium]|nr:di-heme oxidoredictase family protein [Terriglobales bacterium]